MKLFHVTITGADQSLSNCKELLQLSEEFRFVEWGILYSKTKQDELRYPPKEWQNELFVMCDIALETHGWAPSLSAHLCGQHSTDVLFENLLWLPSKHFKRCQINTSPKNLHRANITSLCKFVDVLAPEVNFIFQYRDESDDAKVLEMAEINDKFKSKFDVLYDISGGNGILPTDWPKPFNNVRTGYAGGLNPDNLEEQLTKLATIVGDASVSIDMETGVRTNNEFDLSKVRRCLQIASMWS